MKDRKARLLKELEITEVSLVTSAANEGAKIMFWKNDIEKAQHNNLRTKLISDLIQAIKILAREKGITQLEASKEIFESDTGKKVIETLNTLKRQRGKTMYASVGEIAEAIEKGDLKSKEEVLKELDGLRDRDIAKSDFAKSKQRAVYDQVTNPAWNSLYNAFTNLPETVEEGQAIEKRQRASDNIVKVIEALAGELIQKDGELTKEKAIVKVLDRNPAWKRAYDLVTYG